MSSGSGDAWRPDRWHGQDSWQGSGGQDSCQGTESDRWHDRDRSEHRRAGGRSEHGGQGSWDPDRWHDRDRSEHGAWPGKGKGKGKSPEEMRKNEPNLHGQRQEKNKYQKYLPCKVCIDPLEHQ